MVWKTFNYESELVLTERLVIGNIPCIRFRPRGISGTLPTVIYYHGWRSSKEFQKFKGTALAVFGYQVFIPDAVYHGERAPIDYDKPGALDEYFWKVILQNTEESQHFIESIIEKYDAAPDRIAVVGSSMGGFSAAGIFIKNSNIKCMVSFNGACAWVKAEEIFRRIDNRPPINGEAKAILSKYDPMYNKEKLRNRPILMLHGDSDTSVPIEIQRIFYNEVSPLYSEDINKFKLVEIPRMDHYISTGMLEDGIEWLKLYL